MNDKSIEQEMDLFDIPANLVHRDFQMHPDNDDLIFGTELKPGMVILFEDTMLRTDPSREEGEDATGFWTDKIMQESRWCRIERIWNDSPNDQIIQFIAVYADGTKRKRTYNKSYAWYVKKASIPNVDNGTRRRAEALRRVAKELEIGFLPKTQIAATLIRFGVVEASEVER